MLLFGVTALSALDMPIMNKQEVYLENGRFTVLEFPFEIKKTINSGFLAESSKSQTKENPEIDSVKLPEENKASAKTKAKGKAEKGATGSTGKPVEIKQGKRSLTLLPKMHGTFELVVWGYKKYPMMFTFHVVDNESEEDTPYYYNFLDYDDDEEKAQTYEKTAHEKVIVQLVRSIYNNKLPTGYKNIGYTQKFTEAGGQLSYKLNRSYVGSRYRVDEWLIENRSQEKGIKLYEEMFYSEGVYGISFENDLLKPKEQARMFIVAAREFNTANREE